MNVLDLIRTIAEKESAEFCVTGKPHGQGTFLKPRWLYKVEFDSDKYSWEGWWHAEGDEKESLNVATKSAIKNLIRLIRREKLHDFEYRNHITEIQELLNELA